MFSKRVVKEYLLETASYPELTVRERQDFGECSAQIRSNNRQGLRPDRTARTLQKQTNNKTDDNHKINRYRITTIANYPTLNLQKKKHKLIISVSSLFRYYQNKNVIDAYCLIMMNKPVSTWTKVL